MKTALIVIFALFLGSFAFAQDFEYIGAMKCKMCHNTDVQGKQYIIWKESAHAKAFETLKTPEALKIAQGLKIADPTKDAKCLKCHSTAGAVSADLHSGITVEEGVSCESCHGPGSAYKATNIMKSRELSLAKGLIIPDEKLCKKCHNPESPTYKTFDFASFSAKIAHPKPKAQ